MQERRVYEGRVLTLLAEESQLLDLRADHAVVLQLQRATQRVLCLIPPTDPHISTHVRLLDLREWFLRLTSPSRLHLPVLPLALESLVESAGLMSHESLEPIPLLCLQRQQTSHARRERSFRLLDGKSGRVFHHLRGTLHACLRDSLRTLGRFEGARDGDGGGEAFRGTAGRRGVGQLLDGGVGSFVGAWGCEEERRREGRFGGGGGSLGSGRRGCGRVGGLVGVGW